VALAFANIRILGFDIGAARVGLARSTPLGTAEPLIVLQVKNRAWKKIAAEIRPLCARHAINQFVVGLPRNMDGSLGPQAQFAEQFATRLRRSFPEIPVFFEDERLTTEAAYERLAARGVLKKDKARETVDAVAAAIIVEARLARLAKEMNERAVQSEQ